MSFEEQQKEFTELNKVILVGRVGQTPDIKTFDSGKTVANFSVATNDYGEKTTWHRVSVWGKSAEACSKYLEKGQMVTVDGRIEYRQWEKDGETRTATEIVAYKVDFGPKSGGGSKEASKEPSEPSEPNDSDDDLPW